MSSRHYGRKLNIRKRYEREQRASGLPETSSAGATIGSKRKREADPVTSVEEPDLGFGDFGDDESVVGGSLVSIRDWVVDDSALLMIIQDVDKLTEKLAEVVAADNELNAEVVGVPSSVDLQTLQQIASY